MGGLWSFLGGTAFRWLLGELLDVFKARQEHQQEITRLQLEHEQARERAQWQRDAAQAAAAAGLQVIDAKREADADGAANAAFLEALRGVNAVSDQAGKVAQQPGWIGRFAAFSVALNAFIRPELAQVSICLIAANALWPERVVLAGLVGEVVCGALGLFIGDRIRRQGS